MENVTTVGVDLSKHFMHTVFMNKNGKVLKSKKYTKNSFDEFIKDLPPNATICAEACGGAHHFGRELQKHNFNVKLVPPHRAKAYMDRNKNDFNDAIGIGEASGRERMKFVPIKSEYIQGVQSLHNAREQLKSTHTQYMNSIRGMLLEFGVTISQGVSPFNKYIRESYYKDERIHYYARKSVDSLIEALYKVEEELDKMDKEIKKVAKENATSQRLMTIPGIGEKTATALITVSGKPSVFKNGRSFSTSLGLTPRQKTTGDKPKLMKISKKGNAYVRCLLIICARSLMIKANKTFISAITQRSEYKSNDRMSLWIRKLLARNVHTNKVCVAIANKLARISYRILVGDVKFDANLSNGGSFLMQ